MDVRSIHALQLLHYLQIHEVPYVVVGDTSDFPNTISSDLDLVVDRKAFPRIGHHLTQFCHNHQARIVQALQYEQTATYWVLAFHHQTNWIHFLHPDVCSDYFRDGRLLLTAQEMLERREKITIPSREKTYEYFIPSPVPGFLYYIIKKISKGSFTDEQGQYLSREFAKDQDGIANGLLRYWEAQDATLIIDAAQSHDWLKVRANISKLQKTLRQKVKISPTFLFKEVFRKITRIWHPTGLHIAILGSDGSGKSSVIERIEKNLAPVFRRTKMYHLRPFWGQSTGRSTATPTPHKDAPRGFIGSLVKLGWWWLDFTVGFLVEVFPKLVCSTFVLFDRYYYDILVDSRRYRYGGPSGIAWMLALTIPRPDVIVFLDASPEILYARKPEISLEESARQQTAYRQIIGHMANGVVIDGNKPLATVVKEVELCLLKFLAIRTERRLAIKGH